ncbi:hypothetical protein KFL_001900230 [Klebsormidium nitens]|uniref:Uncharacterized protein n=1 Tax=Klebsormidium nitens TaxID=105231 RepID=A0A1Y1I0L4_KLENI|nr:hypothetical protein KFL_001900230 [Klebsormidium nitens]|eukprot:GAQ84480.1 hypothetical protein KFL_001900230 [Klebsormidium nitens]
MMARQSPEEAGFVRCGDIWICKLLLNGGRVCNEQFSCKKKHLLETHRLEQHDIPGPLPTLKTGRIVTVSEEEKRAKHAARQARYVAKKGPDAMKAIEEASKMTKLTQKFREAFDIQYEEVVWVPMNRRFTELLDSCYFLGQPSGGGLTRYDVIAKLS